MTIKMNKRYAQTTDYVPTQATPWAIDSLNRDASAENTAGMLAAHADRTQEAVTNQHHAPGGSSGMEHAAGRLKTARYISAINESTGRDAFGFDTHPCLHPPTTAAASSPARPSVTPSYIGRTLA